MSQNILIIKHGSFGDIVQINGCLKDIRSHHSDCKIYFLTTPTFQQLMSNCPFIDEILIDERNPRWSLFKLYKIKKLINSFNFKKVYDLQNSSRTEFYRKYMNSGSEWYSSRTILKDNETKDEYDKKGILERFEIQLGRSGVQTSFTKTPQISWLIDESFSLSRDISKKYIVVFPFCSPKLTHKRWPYYQELISMIKQKNSLIDIVVAPGPGEFDDCKDYDAKIVMDGKKSTSFSQLAKILVGSIYVISNDTGPAHLASHLGCRGLAIFGSHTSAEKVSIETDRFSSISAVDLTELSASQVLDKIDSHLQIDDIIV